MKQLSFDTNSLFLYNVCVVNASMSMFSIRSHIYGLATAFSSAKPQNHNRLKQRNSPLGGEANGIPQVKMNGLTGQYIDCGLSVLPSFAHR